MFTKNIMVAMVVYIIHRRCCLRSS